MWAAIIGGVLGSCGAQLWLRGWFRKPLRADPRRVHQLEYDLGFRNDAPKVDLSNQSERIAYMTRMLEKQERGAVRSSILAQRSNEDPYVSKKALLQAAQRRTQ